MQWRVLLAFYVKWPSHPIMTSDNFCVGLQENLVATILKNFHHRWEGEPLWNVLARSQALAKLCARKLRWFQALFLGLGLCGVSSFVPFRVADMDHVGVVADSHA